MPTQTREVRPHSNPTKVISAEGDVLSIPSRWKLLPPGDATLTRRVKSATPSWTVKAKKGRRIISLGLWADAETIEIQRLKLLIERQDPSYKKRLDSGRQRRVKQQESYVTNFTDQVLDYLAFHPRYEAIAKEMAQRIADHATPVGSGTVARTQRIPIEQRAEAATIAWMRHQTTAYDQMVIPKIKGQRRETRRRLAAKSKSLLDVYRRGLETDPALCPLQKALASEKQPAKTTSPQQAELF